jgi:hypothetical protein
MKKKLSVQVEPLDRNRNHVIVEIPFDVVSADSALAPEARDRSAILESSVSPARRKMAAARWLLEQLRSCASNEGAALMFLESVAINLRSATPALQKVCSGINGFDRWYAGKQDEMRADPRLRWLVEMRNGAEKEGLVMGVYGAPCDCARSRGRILQCGARLPDCSGGMAGPEPQTRVHRVDWLPLTPQIAGLSGRHRTTHPMAGLVKRPKS